MPNKIIFVFGNFTYSPSQGKILPGELLASIEKLEKNLFGDQRKTALQDYKFANHYY